MLWISMSDLLNDKLGNLHYRENLRIVHCVWLNLRMALSLDTYMYQL